jgi:hypothetical protein
MSQAPSVRDCSVVVIALVGGSALEACLRRLAPWSAQCLVILGAGMGDAQAWRARHPRARFAEGGGMTVPARRWHGLQAAAGHIVALLEDTSLPEPGWLEGMCDAFADERVAAASGPVRIDPSLAARYRALACAEYGQFHPDRYPRLALGPPDARGTQPVSRLPGNNLAYRRERILEIVGGEGNGLVESEVNDALKARGYALAFQPRMAVLYSAADARGARLSTRMRHGRLYAGLRAAGKGGAARCAGLAKSLLLPAVLAARAMAGMTRAIGPAAWPATAFWIVLLESAWALGEGVGYVAGAGRSVEAWR